MRSVGLLIFITSIVLVGCNQNNENTNSSKLVGSWITKSCDQMVDSQGDLTGLWGKGVYEFDSNNELTFDTIYYSDANCEGELNVLHPPVDASFSYVDNGQVLLQEGVDGGSIRLDTIAGENTTSVTGFYVINDNTLCLSDNLKLYSFSFSVAEEGDSAINYDTCLEKDIQP